MLRASCLCIDFRNYHEFDYLLTYSIVLFISLLFITGCSSSSGSQSPAETDTTSANGDNVTTDNGAIDDGNGIVSGNATDAAVDVAPTGTASGTETTISIPAESTPNSTRVTFGITVPVYLSNALQVRLVWDDIDTTAM